MDKTDNNNNVNWPSAKSIQDRINNDIESIKRENIIEDLRISIRYIIYTLITLPENNQTLYESSFGVTRLCMSIEKLLTNNNTTTTTTTRGMSTCILWNLITLVQDEYKIIEQTDFQNIKHHYPLILTDLGKSRSYIRYLLNQKKTFTFFSNVKELLYKENSKLIEYYKSNSVMLDISSMIIVFDILKKLDDNKFSLIVNSSSFDTLIDHSYFSSIGIDNNENNNSSSIDGNNSTTDKEELNDINEIINNRKNEHSISTVTPVIIPPLPLPSSSSLYNNNNNNNNSINQEDHSFIISQFESPQLDDKIDESSPTLAITKKISKLNMKSTSPIKNNEDDINYSDLLDQAYNIPTSTTTQTQPSMQSTEKEDEINYSDLLDQSYNIPTTTQSPLLSTTSTFKTNAFNNNSSGSEFPSPSNFSVQLPINEKYLYEEEEEEEEKEKDEDYNDENKDKPIENDIHTTTIETPKKTTITKVVRKKIIKKVISKPPLERDIEF